MALVCVWYEAGSAQNSLVIAEAFVGAAYEEVAGDETLNLSIAMGPPFKGNPTDWSSLPEVGIRFERGAHRPILTPEDVDRQLLSVSLAMDAFGRLAEARSHGTYVRSSDLKRVRQFAAEHPDWSDTALLAELKRRGARFLGDITEFEKAARLNHLEPLLGVIVRREIRFDVRYPSGHPDLPDSFHFNWVVDLETAPPDSRCYILTFEPFEARLIRLTRRIRLSAPVCR